jgi:hypothetical protein
MTNAEASAAARRIPFNPVVPLPHDVHAGLSRIAAKQLRRIAIRNVAPETRAVLRYMTGRA